LNFVNIFKGKVSLDLWIKSLLQLEWSRFEIRWQSVSYTFFRVWIFTN